MTNHLEAKAVHHYPFPAERVFDAWLDPKLVGQWMFGPNVREENVVSIEIDPKVGGEFSFLVSRGNQVIDHVGKYAVIDRPKRLEFDWGVKGMSDNSRVAVTMTPTPEGCSLELVHYLHPDWAEYLERSKEGWAHMLGVLETSLKKL